MTVDDVRDRLDAIASRAAARPDTTEVRFAASIPGRGFSWQWTEPGARPLYFVASTTKLATAAIVMQHVDEGRYALETPAHTLLAPGTLEDLHPRASEITVEDLLAHTSGIADYFEGRGADGTRLYDRIVHADEACNPDQALAMVRGAAPTSRPGDRRRAHYSDTNYQLLHVIVEATDGSTYADAVARRVCAPLGLRDTFVFTPETLARWDEVAPVLHGTRPLRVPRAMASFGADGSLVSTAADQLALLEALVAGRLCSPGLFARMTATWRPMLFPLEYGIGIMRFRLPRWMSPLRPAPPLIGHSGASGAILFHDPERGLTVAGTVNQAKHRSLSFRTLGAIERALR
ncbi:serine hydrolase domain-containing protein [Demequina rhizosphaerae]|uniref:serine hydrolase domain-containing protein n=1 Tax=Demequina rhizosphaerae TaxID=1638985 RepID=UPI0007811EC5|nr:serine hydrolase domain-containing protein [Demequina rhizosphaerae]